jgi:hypothetical protein
MACFLYWLAVSPTEGMERSFSDGYVTFSRDSSVLAELGASLFAEAANPGANAAKL